MARRKTAYIRRAFVPSLAKLTPPTLEGVYDRTRLFRILDDARKSPIVWISAPAGAGKTTLIASYIEARNLPSIWYQMDAGDSDVGSFYYYMGLAAQCADSQSNESLPQFASDYPTDPNVFTANFFRQLFSQLRRPSVLVLDNYQDACGESIQKMLQQGFEQIPTDVNAIVISREDPPGEYARARACRRIALLDWNEIRLTEDESDALTTFRTQRKPSRAQLDAIYQQTRGWIAGLVLVTENLSKGPVELTLNAGLDQSVFDYFANEIFTRVNAHAQDFLLRTAYLPRITLQTAERISDEKSGPILRYLKQRNFFTAKLADGTYEYHPLFRSFLISRIEATYTREAIDALKRRSADILADSGSIEMAVTLLLEAKDWQPCLDLVLKHARVLHHQGRTRTLQSWLTAFPSEFYALNPWVPYWLGMCRLPFNPTEARADFENAFAMFEKGTDASPLYLAWSRIIESVNFELDDFGPMTKWLDRYRTLLDGHAPLSSRIENASVFTYISGLINARFEHPDLEVYVKRAEVLLDNESDKSRELPRLAALIPYYLWRGDLAKMRRLLDRFMMQADTSTAHTVARLHGLMWKSICEATGGAPDVSLQATTDGIALAASSGIHLVDLQLYAYGIWGQLCIGNLTKARQLFESLSAIPRRGRINEGIYHHYASMIALYEHDFERAVDHANRATELGRAARISVGAVSFRLGLAFAIARRGDLDAALTTLVEAQRMARAMQSAVFIAYGAFCEANIRVVRGEHTLALRSLNTGFDLAHAVGAVIPAYCPRETASLLCGLALENDIQTDYVRTVIAKMQLAPPRARSVDRWPWQVRIYAFGRFTIIKDGAPLSFSGRAHQKPLALLRAIAGRAERGVNMTELAQTLWPDSDGDMAAHALRTTLYRLRKLIGDQCIETRGGELSINLRFCWIDAVEVEKLLDLDYPLDDIDGDRFLRLLQGPFLEGTDTPWAIRSRERLHGRILKVIHRHGQTLKANGDYEGALQYYLKGIEIGPYTEELYRDAMLCYWKTQKVTAALALFDRCRRLFSSSLKMELASETVRLRDEIRSHQTGGQRTATSPYVGATLDTL